MTKQEKWEITKNQSNILTQLVKANSMQCLGWVPTDTSKGCIHNQFYFFCAIAILVGVLEVGCAMSECCGKEKLASYLHVIPQLHPPIIISSLIIINEYPRQLRKQLNLFCHILIMVDQMLKHEVHIHFCHFHQKSNYTIDSSQYSKYHSNQARHGRDCCFCQPCGSIGNASQ